jgi:catechol 2,3-dioxygenase-like lactoylglutathione lyase family enzyme
MILAKELVMLVSIVAVTIAAPDLRSIEAAYSQHLRYEVVERGVLSQELADAWQAPNIRGRKYLLMRPQSGEPVFLRFVESPKVGGYAPLLTQGWNSTEILVEDPDKLAEQLARSPFRIVGPPRPLTMNPKVRAMQVIGPADELLYLTRIPPGGSIFNLGSAKTWVDRVFIVVLGGPDMAAMQTFYRDVLAMPVTEASPSVVNVVNDAHQRAPDATTPLSIVRFPSSFLIELDEYPPAARARPSIAGELPPGMALVSFVFDALPDRQFPWIVAPQTRWAAPYLGRKVGLLRGAAGELIELVIGQTNTSR